MPDWVCEVLSPATEKRDRADKLPAFAQHGVIHVWLVNLRERTLEVLKLDAERRVILGVWRDEARVRAEPFEAVELGLEILWAHAQPA